MRAIKKDWRGFSPLAPLINHRPWLYYPYMRLKHGGGFEARETSRDTEIVVEGPPRSGNTFVALALEQAQGRPVKIARHRHVAAQAIRGVRLGKPVVVLLRAPEDAIRSFLVFEPRVSLEDALANYWRFYEPLWRHRAGFLTVRFEEATRNLPAVTARINARFGTAFKTFTHSEEEMSLLKARLDALNIKRAGKTPFGAYLPNPVKEAAKAQIVLDPKHSGLIRCRDIHRRFLKRALEDLKAEKPSAN